MPAKEKKKKKKQKQKQKRKNVPKNLVACGLLILRGDPVDSFLLMVHADRLDLPKGHIDDGESHLECALREVYEETGIRESDLEMIPGFAFQSEYEVRRKKYNHVPIPKTTHIYLARLINEDIDIQLTEHAGYLWVRWEPPHTIQENTIDPLLKKAADFLAEHVGVPALPQAATVAESITPSQ